MSKTEYDNAKEKFSNAIKKLNSIDQINNEIWARLTKSKSKDGKFQFRQIETVSFQKNQMFFSYKTESVPLDLKSHFSAVKDYNLFNDPLPETEYKEMKSIFLKYSLLDPLNGDVFTYLQAWQSALENVHVYLGKLETRLVHKTIYEILSYLGIKEEKEVTRITFTPKKLSCGELDITLKVTVVNDNSLSEIRRMMSVIPIFYAVKELTDKPYEVFYWEAVGSNVIRSNHNKTVKKVTKDDHDTSCAVGSISWNSGRHSWKLKLDASITGSTTVNYIHWMVIGITVQSTPSKITPNGYNVSGVTYGYCTYGDNKYYNLGEVSKNYKQSGPGTVLILDLDCEEGTLAFSHEGESPFLIINVPKKTNVSPWVHLYTATCSNMVTVL